MTQQLDPTCEPGPDVDTEVRRATCRARSRRSGTAPTGGSPWRSCSPRFASGVWVVALVWEVIRIGGGAGQLSVVVDRRRRRRAPAGAARRRGRRPGPAEADPAGRRRARARLHGASSRCCRPPTPTQVWHLAVVAFVTGGGMAFYYPAYSAWLPALVPEADLMAVNGFEGMVRPDHRPGARARPSPASWSALRPRRRARARRRRLGWLGLLALATVPLTPVRRDPEAPSAAAPDRHRAGRHPRGLRLHGAHAVAARHAAVRLADDPGDDGPARGAHAVPDQGPARRRPRRPRHGAGRVRHRRRGRLDGDGVAADAAPLPHLDEPDVGRRLPAVHRDGRRHRDLDGRGRRRSCSARCSRRRWSSGARCSSAGCRRTCSAGWPRSTSSSRSA